MGLSSVLFIYVCACVHAYMRVCIDNTEVTQLAN